MGIFNMEGLYAAWRESRDGYNAPTMKTDTPESEAIYERYRSAEDAILFMPATTITELALKIIVADDGGDIASAGGVNALGLLREAYQIAGVPGWTEEDEKKFQEWAASCCSIGVRALSSPETIAILSDWAKAEREEART